MTPRFTAAVESTEGRGSGYVDVARAVSGLVIDPPAPPEPPRLTGVVTTVPASLDPTGATELTVNFQDWLDGVPDGSVVRFPAGSPRYWVEGMLVLRDRRDLSFECGDTAEIFCVTSGEGAPNPTGKFGNGWPRGRARFYVAESSRITWGPGLILDGGDPSPALHDTYESAYESQHGIRSESSTDLVIAGEPGRPIILRNLRGDFIYLGRATAQGVQSDRVIIRHVHGIGAGRQGVAMTNAEDVLVELCDFDLVRRSMFDLEPNISGDIVRIALQHNTIRRVRNRFFANNHGGNAFMGHIKVNYNTLIGQGLVGEIGNGKVRRGPYEFIGNVSDTMVGNPNGALDFNAIDGVTVRENTLVLQEGRTNMSVVYCLNCTDIDVAENIYTGGGAELVVENT